MAKRITTKGLREGVEGAVEGVKDLLKVYDLFLKKLVQALQGIQYTPPPDKVIII